MTVLSLSCFGKGPVPGLGFVGFLLSRGVGLSDAAGGFRSILGTGVSRWGSILGIGFGVVVEFICSLLGVLVGVLLCSLFGVLFMFGWLCSWWSFVLVLSLMS